MQPTDVSSAMAHFDDERQSLMNVCVQGNRIPSEKYRQWRFEKYKSWRREAMVRYILSQDAHIIGLQEVTPEVLAEILSHPDIRDRYMCTASVDDTSTLKPYGQILLSTLPVLSCEIRLLGTSKRVIEATFLTERRTSLTVMCVHLTSGYSAEAVRKRLDQIEILINRIKSLDKYKDIILMGDFNFGDGSPLEEQLFPASLVDIWPSLYPNSSGFTFNPVSNPIARAFSSRGYPLRFDRIFLLPYRIRATEAKVCDPFEPQGPNPEMPWSDHSPLSATFTFSGQKGRFKEEKERKLPETSGIFEGISGIPGIPVSRKYPGISIETPVGKNKPEDEPMTLESKATLNLNSYPKIEGPSALDMLHRTRTVKDLTVVMQRIWLSYDQLEQVDKKNSGGELITPPGGPVLGICPPTSGKNLQFQP
ncbi:hypothetical protein AAMO2058_000777200 [Amorphochlora amoebiformis]